MNSISYVDAVNGALERLQTTGFYLDHSFANHGPMAAEALAQLGYCDEVPAWVEANLRHRDHDSLPSPSHPIDGNDTAGWRAALGQRSRGGDWVEFFRRQLGLVEWRSVLTTWWARLLPGLSGGLTHGLIRTAHAVRGLSSIQRPTALQLDELARGLAFWATVYTARGPAPEPGVDADAEDFDVQAALSDLTVEYAGLYAGVRPSHPVPLIHTITAPAATRLVLAELPPALHRQSVAAVARVSRGLFQTFGGGSANGRAASVPLPDVDRGDFKVLIAEAVSVGDEHAIKICEAAQREDALRPDGRYFAAARTAVELIREL